MKPEGSLPHPKQSAIYSYPEPDQSSQNPPILFFLGRILTIFSRLFPDRPIDYFPSVSPPKLRMHSCIPHTCHVPSPSPEQHEVGSTNHGTPPNVCH